MKHYSPRFSSRWGLPLVALLLGVTLIASSLRSYFAARSFGITLARGQAETFLRAVHARSRAEPGPPSDISLREVLEAHSADGLRYLAVLDRDGAVIASAGTASPDFRGALPAPGVLLPASSVMRMLAPPPGPPAPVDPLSHLPAPPPEAFGPPPSLLIEFEPVYAQRLVRDAMVNVLIGVATAVLLMGAAAVFWRMTLRAERADAELARQHHLASLGEMSAVLAHELRNPLAAAKGHAQLLAEQLEPEQRPRRNADRIVQSLVRLEELTSSLLEFVRTGEVAREPFSPASLLREAAHQLAADRIDLQTAAAPASWPLDPARMRQVLVNVLDNALQASPATARVQAEAVAEGDKLVFRILDAGHGLNPEQAARAFEPFHTTRTRGTGLGLAIAQRIVRLHGGTISLSNRAGGGAVAEIALPRS